MRNELPTNHNLSRSTIDNPKLLFRENDTISITEIQYQALAHGVAYGESMLVVAPTSTGKTQVGVWALMSALERGHRTVYLVTHKALAQQKFEDFQNLLVPNVLSDSDSLVIATGDQVRAADRSIPADPLDAPILVATYEKYLALLSSSGVPSEMTNRTIICDEVQLIGDRTRGQSVEILLTLLKRAKWGQLVALSAVLSQSDSEELADWLGVKLIKTTNREKHLIYECREKDVVHQLNTTHLELKTSMRAAAQAITTAEIVSEVMQQTSTKPVIVFCTSKEDVYGRAEEYFLRIGGMPRADHPVSSDFDEETTLAPRLSQYMTKRIAFHTADLTEQERRFVEDALSNDKVDVVFSTSTLAAGVNFPLSTAIFHKWHRWNGQLRSHEPLDASEFHNMAGRVGRMGTQQQGRVIYVTSKEIESRQAKVYLDLDKLTPLNSRVEVSRFVQTTLHIVASGFCRYKNELIDFLLSTFSGVREQKKNPRQIDLWKSAIESALDNLSQMGFLE